MSQPLTTFQLNPWTDDVDAIREWLADAKIGGWGLTMVPQLSGPVQYTLEFSNKADAALFKLTWGGAA